MKVISGSEGVNADTLEGKKASEFALKTEIPTSLPANGGNADTVGGKSASAFASTEHDHNHTHVNLLRQGGFYRVHTTLPQPGSNVGPGRWFLGFANVPPTGHIFMGGTVRVSGTYSHASIVGHIEREFGYYAGGGAVNNLETRISKAISGARTNLRISVPTIYDGKIGVWIYCVNTNGPAILVDCYSSSPLTLTTSAWESAVMIPQQSVEPQFG